MKSQTQRACPGPRSLYFFPHEIRYSNALVIQRTLRSKEVKKSSQANRARAREKGGTRSLVPQSVSFSVAVCVPALSPRPVALTRHHL